MKDPNTTYWLSLIFIILGSVGVGFILGSHLTVKSLVSDNDDLIDPLADMPYICETCGEPIIAEAPKSTNGRFEHSACRRSNRGNSLLNPKFIS